MTLLGKFSSIVVPLLEDHPFFNEKCDLIREMASLEGENLVGCSSPLKRLSLLQWKCDLIREMASLEGGNLVGCSSPLKRLSFLQWK